MNPEKDCLWGEEFFETYLKHAEERSYFNEKLHVTAALSLIGQTIRNVRLMSEGTKDDGRIHPFIIQSSGTGKNSTFDMVKAVARDAGMDFHEHGSDSAAGVVGTVRRDGQQDTGDLEGSGFVAWKEAQLLLKSAKKQHSSEMLEMLNQALDPDGHVSKTLASGKLSYQSRSSLYCTTYPPDKDDQLELIRQGFLPRTLFLYEEWAADKYDNVNKRRDRNLPRKGGEQRHFKKVKDDFEEDVRKLSNTLRYINSQIYEHGEIVYGEESSFATGREEIYYFEGIEDGVSMNPSPIIDDVLKDFPYRVSKKFNPFRTRYFNLIYRMSAALAVVDKDEENGTYVSRIIKKEHNEQARKIARWSIESVAKFIEDYMEVPGDQQLYNMYVTTKEIGRQNGGIVSLEDITDEVFTGNREIKAMLAKLEEMGKIEQNGTAIPAMDGDDVIKIPEDELRRVS